MDLNDNILHLLFNGKLEKLFHSSKEKWNDELDSMKSDLSQPAITYVSLDANIKTISYLDLLDSCFRIYERLNKLSLNTSSVIIPDVLEGDDEDRKNTKIRIRNPLVIYGDCAHWTPVFMLVAQMLHLPFYCVSDRRTLVETNKQFGSMNLTSKFLVTHLNRTKELLQMLSNNLSKYEKIDIIEEYVFLYDKTICVSCLDKTDHEFHQLDVSYLINTSGTSKSMNIGNTQEIFSKTIFVPHRSIIMNVLDFRNEFNLKSSWDVVLICSPFTFDPSICDIFLGLCSLSHLILLDNSLKNIPENFVKILFQFGVTYMTITPSMWYRISYPLWNIAKTLPPEKIHLRYVNFGGEICPPLDELHKFQSKNIQFRNLYGLSEMSVWASLFDLNKYPYDKNKFNKLSIFNSSNIPIMGRPILETKVYLNEHKEIILESPTRKCLIFDGQWTFRSKLSTNDLGEKIESYLYFIKRKNDTEDFIKLNGVKCFPSAIVRSILSKFGPINEDESTKKFYIENCHVQPGKWQNFPIIEVILVISYKSNLSTNIPEEDIKREISNFLRNHCYDHNAETAIWLHLIDSSQIVLNQNGKLDYQKLRENIAQTQKPMLELKHQRQWSKCEIHTELNEIFLNHLKSFEYGKNQQLWTYGINSMIALEIAIEIENRFQIKHERLYEMLFKETFDGLITSIHDIINSGFSKRLKLENQTLKLVQRIQCPKVNSSVYHSKKHYKFSKTFQIQHEWSYFMEQCVDSSPLIVIFEQKTLLISPSHSGLIYAFDITPRISDDEPYPLRWSQRISSRIEASPIASSNGELIYVVDYSGSIRAFETLSGRFVWQFRTRDQIKSSPIVFDHNNQNQLILCGSFDYHLYCLKQLTGKLHWKLNVNESSISSSPVIWYNQNLNVWMVVICTLNGTIACCRIDNGQIVWKKCYSSKPIFSTPKIYHKKELMVVGITDSRIIAVSLREDGKLTWELSVGENIPIFSSPCLIQYDDDEENLFIITGTNGCSVVCSKLNSLKPLWVFKTESNVYADVLFLDQWNALIVIETNGQMHILDLETGKPAKLKNGNLSPSFSFPGEIFSSPIFYLEEKRLFVGGRDSNIHSIKIEFLE